MQIDAPINPGNSGGPALAAGKVVGVAFQGFSEMQNVGYIVPFPVIRHFLNDIALHKQHTGIVSLGIKAQPMENEGKFKGAPLYPTDADQLSCSLKCCWLYELRENLGLVTPK